MSLILSRKYRESIMIGEDIEITVLGMKGNQVHLSISAPKNIPIHRREIYDRIKDEAAYAELPILTEELEEIDAPALEETL